MKRSTVWMVVGALLLALVGCSKDMPTEVNPVVTQQQAEILAADTLLLDDGGQISSSLHKATPAPGSILGSSPRVLLLADLGLSAPTIVALKGALETGGFLVDAVAPEHWWKGDNPSLTGYDCVIHLNGYAGPLVTPTFHPLPVAGQLALVDFVQNGGGYIGGQWNGRELTTSNPQDQMNDLVLQGYAKGRAYDDIINGFVTWSVVQGEESHPVLEGIAPSFYFMADAHNAGPQRSFTENPSKVLMTATSGGPAVLVREFAKGRIVNFSFAPNYYIFRNTLVDGRIQKLYVNSVKWCTTKEANSPPVANAGSDQTVECNVRSGALVTLDGSASYDPDGDPLTYTWKEGETILASGIQPTANVTLPLGTHDIVLTVDDGNGGTASATVTITVQDTTPPTITIQSSITAGTGAGATACGAVLTNEILLSFASAEDICDGPTTVGLSGVPEGNAFPVGTTTITYTGTDAEGNTATATQNVTVVDNTLPKITAPPTVTAYTGPDAITCGTILNDLGEATASDNCSVASILNNAPADKFFPVGTTTITWTATDVAGNEATATQTITVVDNTPPKITIQSAVVAYTGSGATTCDAVVTDEMLLYFATAQDNCDGNVQVTLRDVPPGNVFPVGTHSITYVAVDAKGNEATAFQNVTVYDNTPPLITGVTATPNTLWPPNHKLVTVTVSVDASDNCGNFTSNILSVVSNEPDNGLGDGDTADDIQNIDGLTVQLRAERSGMGNGRVYTITVRCTDPSGNYTDKLVEVTVPRDKGKKK